MYETPSIDFYVYNWKRNGFSFVIHIFPINSNDIQMIFVCVVTYNVITKPYHYITSQHFETCNVTRNIFKINKIKFMELYF